ncbi:hypothetical protein [Bacillus sp. V5-8f]|uniref:hypothetical protein n=1 Tax=Bacillus sp. V5-8f TaxID=2053044 RepID=UPI0015E0779D|nr:hypothetical protein [Bacillus sp. V5-8f]
MKQLLKELEQLTDEIKSFELYMNAKFHNIHRMVSEMEEILAQATETADNSDAYSKTIK